MNRNLLPLALTVLVSAPAVAAPLAVDEVVVPGQAPTLGRTRIEARDLRETPARELGEALRHVPGLDLVRRAAIASDVVLRGLKADNLNVLVDGQRLHGSCSSRMDPPAAHIDFGEVERVDVIKGPYDVEHPGSLGGLVNVITRAPGAGLGAGLDLQYGSFQNPAGSLRLSYGGQGFQGLGGFAYKRAVLPPLGQGRSLQDLYPAGNANRLQAAASGLAYEANTAWAKVGGELTPGLTTQLDYALQDMHHVLYPALTMDALTDIMQRVNWQLRHDRTGLQAYWNSVGHLMSNAYRQAAAAGSATMRADARSSVGGLQLDHQLSLPGGELKLGVDAYGRNWTTESMMTAPGGMGGMAGMSGGSTQSTMPDVTLGDLGAFARYTTRPLAALQVQAGVRADYAHTAARAIDAARLLRYQEYYPGASPTADDLELGGNVQATWQLAPEWELFGGAARATRMPDPQERYFGSFGMTNWLGNPGLRPTKNHQLDLGGRYQDEHLSCFLTTFASYVQDYINVASLDPAGAVPVARTYANVDAQLLGAELGVQYALPLNLFLALDLAYVQGQNLSSGLPLAEMPPLKGSVALRYDLEWIFVELAERGAATRERVDPQLLEQIMPGWLSTDLKLGGKLGASTWLVGVDNVLDSYHTTDLAYRRDPLSAGVPMPEPGRYVHAGLSYRF